MSAPIQSRRSVNGGPVLSRPPTRRRQAGPWQRWSVLLLSILSASASAAAMGLRWADVTFDGDSNMYSIVENHRDTVQVFISILASTLTLILTYHICLAYNLTMRARLASQKMPASLVRLHVALSRKSMDLNLPFRLLLISALICGTLVLPNWLWNGALTPQLSTRYRSGSLPVPKTGSTGYGYLETPPDIISDRCPYTWQNNGSWTPCIARILSGRISDSMSHATIMNGVSRNFSKFDNSGYMYTNRSFGAGATVGLSTLPRVGSIDSYTYTELGYHSKAACIYNTSSNWTIKPAFTRNNDPGTPNMFLVDGKLPNQADSWGYVVWNLGHDPNEVVAFSASSAGTSKTAVTPIYLSIAAGRTYDYLDKVQCQLSFTPVWHNVSVNLNNQSIHVLPDQQRGAATQPEPRGVLIEWVLQNLKSLTMMGTTLYISSVGDAVLNNLQIARDHPRPIDAKDPLNLTPIQDSLEAAIDDILVALNSIALTKSEYWTSADAQFRVSVVEIGSTKFLMAVFIINITTLIAIVVLCIYTRMFKDSPAFDFADQLTMMAAVACGQKPSEDIGSGPFLPKWDGDPSAKEIAKCSVQLRSKLSIPETPVVLMRANDINDDDVSINDMTMMLPPNTGVISQFHT